MMLCVYMILLMVYGEEGLGARNSRIVRVKQGKLQGIVVVPASSSLGPVESYLGVPYAGAPVGRLRFMPPSAPLSWPQEVVRKVDEYGPVCPQIVPDLSKEKEALRYMTVGRMNYLKKLFKYLQKNQSEDCLYLNIYTPEKLAVSSYPRKLPVIVFVHGESYEWNSGNPYDGSVLASYGQVVVVTLNYRLGFLGFLKTEERGMGNFGLLDILAALHWIQENISQFGGDSESVTLMGQGTGAALTSLLLLSPVSQRSPLFKRAILMSGSSLAKSAIVRDPRDITRQVADETNCPIQSGLLAECLREKDVRTILNLQIKTPAYSTPVGPYVDGFIIPKLPSQLIHDYVPKFDLMFGMTESESFHLFPAYTVSYGVSESEKAEILRTMLRTEFDTFGQNLEQIVQTVENEYRDIYQTREDKLVNLRVLLEIFSDARVVAPLMKTAELHSNNEKGSYLYLFNHTTEQGYYPREFGSTHGEELAYVLGMPLVGGTYHFVHNYSDEEKNLSQHVMSFWVNFAKTGNPGSRSSYRGSTDSRVLYWPPFDPTQKKYIVLGTNSQISSHYKPQKMAVWNKIIPDLVDSFLESTAIDRSENKDLGQGSNAVGQINNFEENFREKTNNDIETKSSGGIFSDKNLPVSLIVIIGLVLLLLNLSACSGVYYQRQRVRRREENLERKIKRLSDAGFRHEELSGNGMSIQNSKEELSNFNFPRSENNSLKRAHFQQPRSNSVKEGGTDTLVLKSALKKPPEAGNRVLYTDQSFTEAAYPSLSRTSKSIPNISFNESVDNSDVIRPISRSSNPLSPDLKLGPGHRSGPDLLVYYDTRPDDDYESKDGANKQKTGSLSRKLPGFLKMRGKDDKVAPPIIEMVPMSVPSTYQFPSRPNSNCLDPIYSSRPHFHRPPLPLVSAQYGITYPNYNPGEAMYPPGHQYLPLGPRLSTPRPQGTPVLTTPRPPTHAMLTRQGSLQSGKVHGFEVGHPSTLPRQPSGHQGDGLIYGYMIPANRSSGPPNLNRTLSVDNSWNRMSGGKPPVSNTVDQTGDRNPLQINNFGNRQSIMDSGHIQSIADSRIPDHRISSVDPYHLSDNYSSRTMFSQGHPETSRPENVITTRAFCVEHPLKLSAESQTEIQKNNQTVLKSELCQPSESASNNKSEDLKIDENASTTTSKPSSPDSDQRSVKDNSSDSNEKSSPTGQVISSRNFDSKVSTSVAPSSKSAELPTVLGATPILRKVGEKTPPGTLTRNKSNSSCKSWYSQYSQAFLSKTIDTPVEDLPPLGDEDFLEDDDSSSSEASEPSRDSQK